MTIDYSAKAAQALSMLERFGQDVTRICTVSGSYVPGGTVGNSSTENTTRKGVKLPLASGITTVRGQPIEAEDIELHLDATGDVDSHDQFRINGKLYTVVSIEELAPAGTPVLYTLHLRRA